MKTILIILLTILAGFCFYTSDPLVLTAHAQIATLMCVLGIGLLIGNMYKGSDKVRKIRKMNKSLLRANRNLGIKNQDLTQKLEEYTRQFLKSNAMNIDLYGAKSENQELKTKVLSLQGNIKQLQKKYEGAKEQITELLFRINKDTVHISPEDINDSVYDIKRAYATDDMAKIREKDPADFDLCKEENFTNELVSNRLIEFVKI